RPVADPRLKLAQRACAFGHSFVVALEPGPKQLLGGDRYDELDPAVGRRVGQYAAGAFAVREVEALGVRAERIRAVATPRHGGLVAGDDEHDAAIEVPGRRRRRAPPFEEGACHFNHSDASCQRPSPKSTWRMPRSSELASSRRSSSSSTPTSRTIEEA